MLYSKILYSKILAPIVIISSLAATLYPSIASSDAVSDVATPHGSTIYNQMDPALIGDWRILQVQIENPAGQVMVFPLFGSILSFLDSGSFKLDYSTENNGERPTDIVAGQFISPTVQSPISTCKIEATGEAIGVIRVGIDASNNQNIEMKVTLDPDASSKPEVRCAGSAEIRGNMVTPPLGAGRTVGIGGDMPYVPYYYSIDLNSLSDLEIWSTSNNPVRVRYYLRKVE